MPAVPKEKNGVDTEVASALVLAWEMSGVGWTLLVCDDAGGNFSAPDDVTIESLLAEVAVL